MTTKQPSIINIGLVGGGDFCREILEKTTAVYEEAEMVAPILAVADPDPASHGRKLASQLGLLTFDEYKQLYDPRYNIHLIIILTPQPEIFENILNTRPSHIRILAYQVFRMFWKAIAQEEQKLRERTKEMETILNGIDDFILVITPEMEILEANESFLNKMGYAREDVIGKKCHQVCYKIDFPCEDGKRDCPLRSVVRYKGPVRQIQTRTLLNGQTQYFEI
jgi:two-component system NtrC family sensor kinase